MTKNIVSVAAAVLGAGMLMTGCNFDQPEAGCIVQDASFANWAVKYDLKEGQTITQECQASVITGEPLGVFKFTDPTKPNSSVLTLRPRGLYSKASLDPCDAATQQSLIANASSDQAEQIKAELAAECGPPETSNYAQTAHGHITDETGAKANTDKDFCATSDWVSASVRPRPSGQVRPDVAPTTTITYEFSNVKVYSAPDAPGTQLTGDLKYTKDNCTATYTVRAIWPAVGCNPDSEKPAEKCGEGSGINPDFDVQCDTSVRVDFSVDDDGNFIYAGSCVPSKAIPSFKTAR